MIYVVIAEAVIVLVGHLLHVADHLQIHVSELSGTHGEVTAFGPACENQHFAAEAAMMLCCLFACLFQLRFQLERKRKEQRFRV